MSKCGGNAITKLVVLKSNNRQQYLLICCQNPRGTGGMIDKPGKPPDLYHTCYALSGLSLAQHAGDEVVLLGTPANLVEKTDPVHNVLAGKAEAMVAHFRGMQVPELMDEE